WRLYVSYVDGRSGRWRVDLLEADAPDRFDPATRTATFAAENADAVAVKDPWLRRVGGRWLMFVSYGTMPDDLRGIHAGEDALARSPDLRRWERLGDGPAVGAAGGPGTVRYVESLATPGGTLFFYEYTRPDGSHELRASRASGTGPGEAL